MPGMLPGMKALTTTICFWLAAVLHVQLVVEVAARLSGLRVPTTGGGALVVGITKVPLPGARNSMPAVTAASVAIATPVVGAAGGAGRPAGVAL